MVAINKWIIGISSLVFSGCSITPPVNADMLIASQPRPVISFNVKWDIQANLSLQETRILVQTNHSQPVQVSSLNIPLLRQWNRIYFKVNDYDRDGMNDLAILQSVGRVGTQRCYGIYRYNPATGMFRNKKSFDRCDI
uniref:Lipoprotein n=1 Tax=uncultured Thiotrichaceae bacterium TaxID=298394 RepID=A0A6S6TTK4_9GAMM|nr:MAG: Unknown protein [uncultured Thiotrichaceae bacterium]